VKDYALSRRGGAGADPARRVALIPDGAVVGIRRRGAGAAVGVAGAAS
jgi:hypothetical protein